MTRRRVSNPLALAVLSCLAERPMHPYEISTTLRSRGKENSIKLNYGSLYSVVDALHKHALIEPQEVTRAGRRPERTVYAITEAGLAEFEDWLAELLSTPVRDFTSLQAGLSLMPGLPPDEVVRLLTDRAARLKIDIAASDASLAVTAEQDLPDLFVIEERFRREMLAAELGFVERLISDIRSASLGGTKMWRRIHELRAAGVTVEEIFADPVRHLGADGRLLVPNTLAEEAAPDR